MTTATVREAIHERLDPVIEEIVTREISQRGGGYGRGLEAEQGPFQALMPVLLSTLLQRRPSGQEPQQILQNILPVLPALLPILMQQGGPKGGLLQSQQQPNLQTLAPVLVAALAACS